MKTYQEAQAVIKARETKKLENNTYLVRRSGDVLAVRLHATDVVTYYPDGRIKINSGGWRTVTTKDRINKYAPISLWANHGQWVISAPHRAQDGVFFYQDNMTINPDGTFSGIQTATQAKAEQKLRAQVRKYAKDYIAALKAGKVPAPSGGDCWFCALKEVKTGKPLGELTDNGHIGAHLKERYYVPSLAWNALKAMGSSRAAQHDLAYMQKMHEGGYFLAEDTMTDQIEKAIRRYVYRELGLAY